MNTESDSEVLTQWLGENPIPPLPIVAAQAALIRELVGALKHTALVVAGEATTKADITESLMKARAALSRVPEEYK